MYHASSERASRAGGGSRRLDVGDSEGLRNRRGGGPTGGRFLALEDSSDSDDDRRLRDADKLFESDLLRGLYMWMDRLCEGTLQRFRVGYWPEMVAEDAVSGGDAGGQSSD